MRERIKEGYWVITKISLGDNPVITQGRRLLTCFNYFDLTSNDNVANVSVHENYCVVNLENTGR